MSGQHRGEAEATILGIVRSKDDPLEWKPFTDEETALHAGLNDIVFGKTLSECAATLRGMFPVSDSRLTRLRQYSTYGGCRNGRNGGRWGYDPVIEVLAEDQQYYDGDDRFVALALAKEFGSIRCELDRYNYGSNDPINWAEEGCVISSVGYHGTISEIRYNPKGVLRALKAAKTRAENAPVKCNEVSEATWQMRNLVREHISSLSYESPDGRYSRYSVAWLFLETIKYFSFVFGPYSYRRHPDFRTLKLQWKAKAERSRKAFLNCHGRWDVIPKFCNVMDHEIRVRNGKLVEKANDWQPKGVFPDFDEFGSHVYDKVIKAREKEEAAQAKAKAKAKARRTRSKSRSS